MDFNLKHWRDKSEEGQETAVLASAKQPRLLLNTHPEHPQRQSPASAALPLFAPEPASSLSARSSDNSTPASATKIPSMGSYFSLAQWQELELQALIFRHMIAGAAVPPELLHRVKKSLIPSSPSPPPFYLCNPLHQYYQQYQPALLQSGYWGRAMMDSEPGRCRRTDGKKWRCSRDVVAGQKYCERHMHRGRNRSRKPVETTTSTSTTAFGGGSAGGEALKTIHSTTQGMAASGAGGTTHFSLSGPSSSMDLLHLSRRPSDSIIGFEAQKGGQNCGRDRTLRRFFDDWPRPLHETEDNATNSGSSATTLSMSTPGNPSSDFSLKLGTGNMEEFRAQVGSGERGRPQVNWGTTWETNRVAPMGGPLAEALRSSMSTSSPTSVLHRLARSSASETSCVSS